MISNLSFFLVCLAGEKAKENWAPFFNKKKNGKRKEKNKATLRRNPNSKTKKQSKL